VVKGLEVLEVGYSFVVGYVQVFFVQRCQIEKSAEGFLPSEHIIHLHCCRFALGWCLSLVRSFQILDGLIRIPPMEVFDLVQLLVELVKRVACRYGLYLSRPQAFGVIVYIDKSFGLILDAGKEACNLVVSIQNVPDLRRN